MRHTAITLFLLVLTGCAIAQNTPTDHTPAPLTQDSSLDAVLDALDARGRDLHSLSADVKMTETDAGLGASSARSGHFWLMTLPDGSTRARALFDRKTQDDRTTEEKIEYVFANGKLIDRNYARETQVTRLVLKPGEKMNLLKLGEGPFPLPIGQKRQDVCENFDVSKIAPSSGDASNMLHVRLIPKSGTSLARKFKSIDVWVDPSDQLPKRIETVDQNETERRRTDLSDVAINTKLNDADLEPGKVPNLSKWNLVDESFQK
ncbi:MAG: LolA family protein [Tepidisphaeraceae bacterium]